MPIRKPWRPSLIPVYELKFMKAADHPKVEHLVLTHRLGFHAAELAGEIRRIMDEKNMGKKQALELVVSEGNPHLNALAEGHMGLLEALQKNKLPHEHLLGFGKVLNEILLLIE